MADPKLVFNATSGSSYISSTLAQLPRDKWWGDYDLYKWEGIWYLAPHLEGALAVQSRFEAYSDDVIIASSPKTGVTWLKALVSSIMKCCRKVNNSDAYIVDDDVDLLITNHPHAIVQTLEGQAYKGSDAPDLLGIPSPRLFHTHMSYNVLPESMKNTDCKIIYITRNPKDTFVSLWHFVNTTRTPEQGPLTMEEAFEGFCKGVHPGGPFFDHVLQYWKESLERPNKILFMKYEEMIRDPRGQVKRLASFLGRPFLNDEEADMVLGRCSLDRLKNLEVNKTGPEAWSGMANSAFFRLGVVGDWKNSFTPAMTERLDKITRLKLEGSGLNLES